MPKFRKKPVVIEAEQFTGTNAAQILYWVGSHAPHDPHERLALVDDEGTLKIKTLESAEGYHVADKGDWIIRGVKGEFYPCKPDIFEATYEPVTED